MMAVGILLYWVLPGIALTVLWDKIYHARKGVTYGDVLWYILIGSFLGLANIVFVLLAGLFWLFDNTGLLKFMNRRVL